MSSAIDVVPSQVQLKRKGESMIDRVEFGMTSEQLLNGTAGAGLGTARDRTEPFWPAQLEMHRRVLSVI